MLHITQINARTNITYQQQRFNMSVENNNEKKNDDTATSSSESGVKPLEISYDDGGEDSQESETKRRRLSDSDNKDSANDVVRPDCAKSSSSPTFSPNIDRIVNHINNSHSPMPFTALTQHQSDSPVAGRTDNDILSKKEVPTAQELSKVLCRIVDDETYQWEKDGLAVLKKLYLWAENQTPTKPEEKSAYYKHFLLYGGCPKILDFLQQHKDDVRCITSVAKLIMMFVFEANRQVSTKVYAGKIAKEFVTNGGIGIFLNIIDDVSSGAEEHFLHYACAIEKCWTAIRNVICMNTAIVSMKREEQVQVLDSALKCLVATQNQEEGIATIRRKVIRVIDNLLRNNFFMAQNKDLKERKVISYCLGSLMVHHDEEDDENCNGSNEIDWADDEEAVAYTLSICFACFRDKKGIVAASDEEKMISLSVFALKQFPSNAIIQSNALPLLESSLSKASKTTMEESNVLEGIASILKSNTVNAAVKEEARGLLKKMYH